MTSAFYDIRRTYDENYDEGPFGKFASALNNGVSKIETTTNPSSYSERVEISEGQPRGVKISEPDRAQSSPQRTEFTDEGPFGKFASALNNDVSKIETTTNPSSYSERVEISDGFPLKFGIPAGPLLNADYCIAAFKLGYDLAVYKTVRASSHPCNDFPNVLFVHPDEHNLTLDAAKRGVLTDEIAPSNYTDINISNSFGVPSKSPDIWQPDMKRAVEAAGDGQVLIGSFQGAGGGSVQSFVDAAKLIVETGAKVLEMNTSCPNEGRDNLLCFDPELVGEITEEVKQAIGDVPLFIKIAYLNDANSEDINTHLLEKLVHETVGKGRVQGVASINTISARLINKSGGVALPGIGRETSGVCGSGIKWAGLRQTKALVNLREQMLKRGVIDSFADFTIAGVGGVMTSADYFDYLDAGADEVFAATGPMFNPWLAFEIKQAIASQQMRKLNEGQK